MQVRPFYLNAALVYLFFFLTLFVDKTGLYSAYFYVASLLFFLFLFKKDSHLFEQKAFPLSFLVFVILLAYLVLANFAVLGFHRSYRAVGNSVETLFFIFMAYSASLVFLRRRALFSRLFFALVVSGFVFTAYPYVLSGYELQRIVGAGFLSKAILGPSVLFVYWLLGCFLYMGTEAKLKDVFAFSLATVCVLMYALLSQSRGPIAAVLVSIACGFFISFFSCNKRRLSSSLLVLLLSIVTIGYVFLNILPLSTLFQRGTSYRLDIWAAVLGSSGESFWLGNGVMAEFAEGAANKILIDSIGYSINHAHNTLVQLFYDGGLIGLFIFLLAIALMFYEVVFKHRDKMERYWVGVIALGVIMINFTDTSKLINPPKEGWVMLWLPIAFIAALVSSQKAKRCIHE